MPSDPDRAFRATAIIVAGGRGERFGDPDKILLPLAGKPLVWYSIEAAESAASIDDIIIVAGLHTKSAIEQLVEQGSWRKVRQVVPGGERRQDSVEAGMRLVPAGTTVVAIHDGARPLVTAELFDQCVTRAASSGAAITAIPVVDTLKMVDGNMIRQTVPRDGLWAAQTPQAFEFELLHSCFRRVNEQNLEFTDEAALLEALGCAVAVVPGSASNVKITRPEDVPLAEALLFLRRAKGFEG